jgi:hypothetical protein
VYCSQWLGVVESNQSQWLNLEPQRSLKGFSALGPGPAKPGTKWETTLPALGDMTLQKWGTSSNISTYQRRAHNTKMTRFLSSDWPSRPDKCRATICDSNDVNYPTIERLGSVVVDANQFFFCAASDTGTVEFWVFSVRRRCCGRRM